MTLAELYALLNGIELFANKVAYRCFPESNRVELPFVCYLVTQTSNFMADGQVYRVRTEVNIELYTKGKDLGAENALETALNGAGIPWNKDEEYLEDEGCYQITYEIVI